MTQTFQRYEEEFKILTKKVKASFEKDNGGGGYKDEEIGGSDGGTAANKSASNMLGQCDELLQQMALEARSVRDASLKRELLGKVRNYKNEIQFLKDANNKKSVMLSARGNVITGGDSNAAQHRERLLQQREMVQNQKNQLDSARRVLQETEQVALEIGEELQSNRATIESAHGRVRQVTSLTGRARRVVASINQRAVQQKMLLYGLAASVAIVLFIFIKWLR